MVTLLPGMIARFLTSAASCLPTRGCNHGRFSIQRGLEEVSRNDTYTPASAYPHVKRPQNTPDSATRLPNFSEWLDFGKSMLLFTPDSHG